MGRVCVRFTKTQNDWGPKPKIGKSLPLWTSLEPPNEPSFSKGSWWARWEGTSGWGRTGEQSGSLLGGREESPGDLEAQQWTIHPPDSNRTSWEAPESRLYTLYWELLKVASSHLRFLSISDTVIHVLWDSQNYKIPKNWVLLTVTYVVYFLTSSLILYHKP